MGHGSTTTGPRPARLIIKSSWIASPFSLLLWLWWRTIRAERDHWSFLVLGWRWAIPFIWGTIKTLVKELGLCSRWMNVNWQLSNENYEKLATPELSAWHRHSAGTWFIRVIHILFFEGYSFPRLEIIQPCVFLHWGEKQFQPLD